MKSDPHDGSGRPAPGPRPTWQSSFRSLLDAVGDVARAEADVLKEDIAQWGKRFGIAVALFAVAFMTTFWLVALVLYAAVRGVEQLFAFGPVQAALIVAGAVLGFILLLGLIGYFLLRSVSGPMAAVRRRYRDHRRWWRQHVMGETEPALDAPER